MMITTAQARASLSSAGALNAAAVASWSAIGSRRIPNRETCLRRRAIHPSRTSVIAANRNRLTPAMCCGNPTQSSENLVSNTTTSSGTMKMRTSVSRFGRFMIGGWWLVVGVWWLVVNSALITNHQTPTTNHLSVKLIRDRHSPVASEGSRRDFDSGRGLAAFVFAVINLPDDPADGLFVVALGPRLFQKDRFLA